MDATPFYLLNQLPGVTGDFIWGTANVLSLWFGVRVFGGRPALVLLSYQALYTAYLGQVSGVTVAGLALLWWGMHRERWHVAGLGGFLAATKFQLAGTLGLALWLLAAVSWRDRLKTLILPAGLAVLSVLIRPQWPQMLLDRLQNAPPEASGSVSLWPLLGLGTLLLWLPVLLVKMPPGKRVVLVGICAALATPYFQQNDLVHLWALPIGYVPLVGYIGYLFPITLYAIFDVLSALLLGFYAYVLYSVYREPAARGTKPEALSMGGIYS